MVVLKFWTSTSLIVHKQEYLKAGLYARRGEKLQHTWKLETKQSILKSWECKKGYNEVIPLNKDNPNYDPTKAESKENSWLIPITDRQGINNEFHQAFQKIYSKQDVEDSSEAIQKFLDSDGDTKPL